MRAEDVGICVRVAVLRTSDTSAGSVVVVGLVMWLALIVRCTDDLVFMFACFYVNIGASFVQSLTVGATE